MTSRKEKSSLVRGAGYLASIFTRLDKAVQTRGGTDEQLHVLGTDDGEDLIGRIADLIVGAGQGSDARTSTVVDSFELVIDHDVSVARMVDRGRYDGYVNPNITETNFPHLRKGVETVTIDLVKFYQPTSSKECERQLGAYGDMADMDDMLWSAASHPDKQRQYPIIFLGAVWVHPNGSRRVGILSSDSSRHCRDLGWDDPSYLRHPSYVFAVRRRT